MGVNTRQSQEAARDVMLSNQTRIAKTLFGLQGIGNELSLSETANVMLGHWTEKGFVPFFEVIVLILSRINYLQITNNQ